jgi:hypothetical protein
MELLWLLLVVLVLAVVVGLVALQRRRRSGSVLSVDSVRRPGGEP